MISSRLICCVKNPITIIYKKTMSCGKTKTITTLPDGKEQIGAPCPIGVLSKNAKNLNYIVPPPAPPEKKSALKKPTRPSKNVIRIRLDGVPKDVVIRFGDKETLLGALKASIALINNENN